MRRQAPLLAIALVLLGAGCDDAADEDRFRVAFVYVGPVGDAGWTYAHDQGRLALEKAFPDIETGFVENVPENDATGRIEQFARHGYDIVFTTSFGFMDPTMDVAGRYPDTLFMHCAGYKRSKNVGTYFGRMYQAKYLAGVAAAKVSKKGSIGYVAPFPIPEVIRHVNAFALGARSVNPAAEVRVVWVHSWFDPPKEKDAAASLLDGGLVDVVATGCDSAAPLVAAQEKGAWAIGYDSDNRKAAPKAFLTAPVWDWSVVYVDFVRKVRGGELTDLSSVDYWGGIETGIAGLAPFPDDVPAGVKDLVEATRKQVAGGSLVVFRGPVRRQDGSLAVAEGEVPSDRDLLEMDWFVEGVLGQLPRKE